MPSNACLYKKMSQAFSWNEMLYIDADIAQSVKVENLILYNLREIRNPSISPSVKFPQNWRVE